MPSGERQPATFGYTNAPTRALLRGAADTISRYCTSSGLPPLRHVFTECAARSVPLLDRPLAKRLLNELRRGDCLVVTSADCMFSSLPHAMRELLGLRRMGIHTHILDWLTTPLSPLRDDFHNIADAILYAASKMQPEKELAKAPPYFAAVKNGIAPTPDTILAQWALAELATGRNLSHIRNTLDKAWWTAEIGSIWNRRRVLWVTGVFATADAAQCFAKGAIVGRCVPSVGSPPCRCQSEPCDVCHGTRIKTRPFSRCLKISRLHEFKQALHKWTWPTTKPHFHVITPGLPIFVSEYLPKEQA